MDPTELKQLIDHRLRQLPTPQPPGTLLPRVMDAVLQWSERPWYRRAWRMWPTEWRLASAAASALAIAAAILLAPALYDVAAGLVDRVSHEPLARIASLVERVELAAGIAHVIWRALVEPLLPYALALTLLMYVACVCTATALTRLLLGKAANQ